MRQFYFIIVSTFIIGMCAGAYIYIASRDENSLFDFGGVEEVTTFEVIADTYGGCMRMGACASYRIDEEGEFTYLMPSRDAEPVRISGSLASDELTALKRLVRDTDLSAAEGTSFVGTCAAMVDASAYRYTLVYEDEQYVFDSCEQALNSYPLFDTLEAYFSELSKE